MTSDRQYGGEPPNEEELPPWLAPIEEEEEPSGPSLLKVIGLAIFGMLLIGAIVGGYSWWSNRGATSGNGELIAAPAEPYKVPPDNPGGMQVEGEGDVAFAASAGDEPQARIDMNAVAEKPITEELAKDIAMLEDPEPKPVAPGFSGSDMVATIQLGAFSSEAAANSAWKGLAGRFKYMEPLAYSIVPVKSGDKTLYRLRAKGEGAANICGRLRIAGETCTKVD